MERVYPSGTCSSTAPVRKKSPMITSEPVRPHTHACMCAHTHTHGKRGQGNPQITSVNPTKMLQKPSAQPFAHSVKQIVILTFTKHTHVGTNGRC